MGAPFYNILQKCDLALVAYIISEHAGTTDDVHPAKRSQAKTLPCTICESKTAKPCGRPNSGVYEVEACIYVRTEGSMDTVDNESETPAAESADRVASTWDLFNVDGDQAGRELADNINAAAAPTVLDFTVQSVEVTEIRAGFEAKGDAWADILDLKLIVCPQSGV